MPVGGTTPGETDLDEGVEGGSWKFVGFEDAGDDDVAEVAGEDIFPNWLAIIVQETKEILLETKSSNVSYQFQRQNKRNNKSNSENVPQIKLKSKIATSYEMQ